MAEKFIIRTTMVEEFDSEEAREHYVKEHMEVSFDTKLALLKDASVTKVDEADDTTTVTVELLTEEK